MIFEYYSWCNAKSNAKCVCMMGDGLINFGTRLSVTHLNLAFMWCWFGLEPATVKRRYKGNELRKLINCTPGVICGMNL